MVFALINRQSSPPFFPTPLPLYHYRYNFFTEVRLDIINNLHELDICHFTPVTTRLYLFKLDEPTSYLIYDIKTHTKLILQISLFFVVFLLQDFVHFYFFDFIWVENNFGYFSKITFQK